MDRIDTLVVGAGVVGLAAARALAQAGREVVVVEAESAIGQGVSARNSEVIHAGLYYAPGSLKARLCRRGRALMLALAERHGVPHRLCGKLVVATEPGQHAALQALAARAAANGVPTEWLDGPAARAREPALHCSAALWSPDSGIVDSHALMLALQADLERAGGQVVLRTRVQSVQVAAMAPGATRQPMQVVLSGDDGPFELEVACLVNAAGLGACALARALQGLDPRHVPVPHHAKGSYFTLAGRAPFACLVYPAPVDAWLGVHLTLDMSGQARFGPDLEWLPDGTPPAQLDYRVDPARAAGFEAAVRRYWPGLPDGALQPAYSGVRPKIHGPGEPAPDFRIDGPAVHGVPGLVNLFGIESPGLTSALAIGEQVASLLEA